MNILTKTEIVIEKAIEEVLITGNVKTVAANVGMEARELKAAVKRFKTDLLSKDKADVAISKLLTNYDIGLNEVKKVLEQSQKKFEKGEINEQKHMKTVADFLNLNKTVNEIYSTYGITPNVSSIKGGFQQNIINIDGNVPPENIYSEAIKKCKDEYKTNKLELNMVMGKKVTRPEDLKNPNIPTEDDDYIEAEYTTNENNGTNTEDN